MRLHCTAALALARASERAKCEKISLDHTTTTASSSSGSVGRLVDLVLSFTVSVSITEQQASVVLLGLTLFENSPFQRLRLTCNGLGMRSPTQTSVNAEQSPRLPQDKVSHSFGIGICFLLSARCSVLLLLRVVVVVVVPVVGWFESTLADFFLSTLSGR